MASAVQLHDHTYPVPMTHYQLLTVTSTGNQATVAPSYLMFPTIFNGFFQPINLTESQVSVEQSAAVAVTQLAGHNMQPLSISQLDKMHQSRSSRSRTSGHHAKRARKNRVPSELELLVRNNVITERRQQVMLQNQWAPITQDSVLATDDVSIASLSTISADTNNTTPTPFSTDNTGASCCANHSTAHLLTPVHQRPSPLPVFEWADSHEMWQMMMAKEELPGYHRDRWWFGRHEVVQPRMRTILLDWLMEICVECCLRRETFHVAVDFIDRYLSRTNNITKHQLQLVGITALFVAAKVEEVRPLRVADLSYMTGEVCTDKEILDQERTILSVLKWDLMPISVVSWVRVFLQSVCAQQQSQKSQFMTPQFSQYAFVQIMRLLDLCQLDSGCLQFTYSILAASAMSYLSSRQVALSVSGYQWTDIASCVQWMSDFAAALVDIGPTPVKYFDRVSPSETHTIQTHVVNINTLEIVHKRKMQ